MSAPKWKKYAWLLPVTLVASAGFLFSQRGPASHPVPYSSARLNTLFDQEQSEQDVRERVAFWSLTLLENPELLSALGPGPKINDSAPIFPSQFDCTTFVETVGALAQSTSSRELADRIIRIRYRNSKISFENRNHFPEADWIPNNESAHILRDITTEIARESGYIVSFVNKDIDKQAWFKTHSAPNRNFASVDPADTLDEVTVKLPYLPINRMASTLKNIPQGAIVNIVRENSDRHPVLISHQGFLIWKDGVAYFRHASRNKPITELPFKNYIQTLKDPDWKILGFNVNSYL